MSSWLLFIHPLILPSWLLWKVPRRRMKHTFNVSARAFPGTVRSWGLWHKEWCYPLMGSKSYKSSGRLWKCGRWGLVGRRELQELVPRSCIVPWPSPLLLSSMRWCLWPLSRHNALQTWTARARCSLPACPCSCHTFCRCDTVLTNTLIQHFSGTIFCCTDITYTLQDIWPLYVLPILVISPGHGNN